MMENGFFYSLNAQVQRRAACGASAATTGWASREPSRGEGAARCTERGICGAVFTVETRIILTLLITGPAVGRRLRG